MAAKALERRSRFTTEITIYVKLFRKQPLWEGEKGVVAPLALVMIFPMMSQLCKGINFFASRQKALATAAYNPFGAR